MRLSWTLAPGDSAEEYAVFRSRIDPWDEEPERLLERISAMEFTDRRVRNGRTYAYRIAAGAAGQFGERSDEVEARPGLFTAALAGNDEFTRQRGVSVTFTVPSESVVRLSEDAGDFPPPWQSVGGPVSWTLSSGDGLKTVYARFRLADGSETVPVFDTITLDRKAVIESVSFEGAAVRQPGETIRFQIDAGEPDGSATLTVAGAFDAVPLFDDGAGGDAAADDGIYTRDLTVPSAATFVEREATGAFTDAAGNVASPATAAQRLTVQEGPEPVDLLGAVLAQPPDPALVTVRWSESRDDAFSAYRLFRSQSAPVDSLSELIETATSSTTVEFEDADVVEGRTYSYRIYVQDEHGLASGSNTLDVPVPNVRPPAAVTLETPSATSETAIALEWSKATDLDFAAYRVHRNETGAVTSNDELIGEIDDIDRLFWDDTGLDGTGLVENTTYYYRVFLFDQADLSSRSNEVEARTKNQAPPDVVMNDPTAVDSMAATLSWEESAAHDFAYYRLYRDEIPTVTTESHLVIELDDTSFNAFRDSTLQSEQRYHYRVFVVDDAPSPKSTGSNTVSVDTP